MTKKTKLIGSASGILAVAAFTGLLAGTAHASTTRAISQSTTGAEEH